MFKPAPDWLLLKKCFWLSRKYLDFGTKEGKGRFRKFVSVIYILAGGPVSPRKLSQRTADTLIICSWSGWLDEEHKRIVSKPPDEEEDGPGRRCCWLRLELMEAALNSGRRPKWLTTARVHGAQCPGWPE